MKKSYLFLKWVKILCAAFFVAAIVYFPVFRRYFEYASVYCGAYDGTKQLIPFQIFLYDRISHLSSLYDIGLGLGGDYFTDLVYYYATSPIMYINFLCIKVLETISDIDPSNIDFWAANLMIVAYFKCVLTFLAMYGMLKMFDLKNPYCFLAAMLYSASTILYFFNFLWSFFGDVLIYLPLSIWGMERFFKTRKIGIFILAISLTLFSNFYFSYYEVIALTIYLIYRMIASHPDDIVTRWKKLWLLCPTLLISMCIASFGFFTGVYSFLSNDRKLNHFHVPRLLDVTLYNHIFSNDYYFTISFIVLVALFSFKLYRHYYYRLFAILTWLLLIGTLSPYTDSLFNGLSYPERRWGYLLVFSSSILIALWLKHVTELTWREYLISLLPLIPFALLTFWFAGGRMWWMIATALIIYIMAFFRFPQQSIPKWCLRLVVCLFVLQQFVMLLNYHTNNIVSHVPSLKNLDTPYYHSTKLQKTFDEITEQRGPFARIDYIDYLGTHPVNSNMIYDFNGLSLYSSIFDGTILDYYDNIMQINTGYDSNSTYRSLGHRANLYALWGVTDRIAIIPDKTTPYGMKTLRKIKDDERTWTYSRNMMHYPAAHLTSKVYDAKDLKSPLDREQAYLQGVVLDDVKGNTSFKANPNLIDDAEITPRRATYKGNRLDVKKDDGGLNISMPIDDQYEDYYLEMDVELLKPNIQHYIKVDGFQQHRVSLSYKYKRFVTPITIRVPAKETMRIKLLKGTYRLKIKGIYGEDYTTLHKAQKEVTPVKVTKTNRDFRIEMKPKKKSYLVLPIPYREGLKAEVNGEARPVKKGNGLQTIIPVNKGDKKLILYYELPYWRLYLVLTIVGIVGAFVYRWWLREKVN